MTDKPSADASPPQRTAYLVLGMHRSGTSALANLLALAGADLPREVMPADAHNARGYFEPWRIAVFNDRRLAAAGTAWDDPFATLAPAPDDEADWREEARRLFRAQFGRRRRPLLKDPRVSVLSGLWRQVLEAEGLEMRVLIPVRHPLAVAGSLSARDGFPPLKSVMVWLAYMLAAEAASRGTPRAFVDYDALLEDWRPQITTAEAQLGEPLPNLSPAAGRKIDAFLSAELRRNEAGGDLAALGEAGTMAGDVLDWLCAAARGERPDPAPLTRATQWLGRQKALYGDLVSPVSADRAVARTALADAEGRAAWLARTLEAQVALTEDLRRKVSGLEERLADSQASVWEAVEHLETLLAAD
ncbi:MAG: sulfotransferase family protein [Phenylobacterium sp.]